MTEHDAITWLAGSRLNVLVCGETGTGKRTACARLHGGPLLYTSAAQLETGPRSRRALVAAASGVVLVRPAELSPMTQLDLAAMIDERIDVRWFATAEDPHADRLAGRFVPELYFRLAAITIELPPVRDLGAGLDAVVAALLARHGRAAPVPADALAMLRAAAWPGNFRELANALARWSRMDRLDAASLARVLDPAPAATGHALADELAAHERRRMREALERFGGNQTRAAALLGMPRRTFLKRLDTYGLR